MTKEEFKSVQFKHKSKYEGVAIAKVGDDKKIGLYEMSEPNHLTKLAFFNSEKSALSFIDFMNKFIPTNQETSDD